MQGVPQRPDPGQPADLRAPDPGRRTAGAVRTQVPRLLLQPLVPAECYWPRGDRTAVRGKEELRSNDQYVGSR